MKGKVLVVDDRKKFDYDNIVYATTSEQAIKLCFDDRDWDEVWLDHDLGWSDIRSFVRMLEYSAQDFVPDEDKFNIKVIRIISYNSTGRRYIWDALHKWYDVDTNDEWENHLTGA